LDDPVGIFLLDASVGVKDLPAMYLYSLATRYRLGIDAINIVNKSDLLSLEEIRAMRGFLSNPTEFEEIIKAEGTLLDVYSSISEMLQKVLPAQRIPFVSARTGMGFGEMLDMPYEVRCSCGDLT